MRKALHSVARSDRRAICLALRAVALVSFATGGQAWAAPDPLSVRAARSAGAVLSALKSVKPEYLIAADRSYYLSMRDGVHVAVSLWLPKDRPQGAKLPVALTQTRYGRRTTMIVGSEMAAWLARGYAVVAVDVRGTTASSGAREWELSDAEAGDTREIVAHLASQPWSNGKVLAVGHSYSADSADIATSADAPALVGAIAIETDFDIGQHLIQPGGVLGRWTIETWGGFTEALDTGRMTVDGASLDCAARVADCAQVPAVWAPVDEDRDFARLRSHLAGRKRWTAASDWAANAYRGSIVAGAATLFGSSPAARLDAMIRQRKPIQYWGSWFDAGTAEAALARYRSTAKAGVPVEVWISSNDHEGKAGTDPFFPDDRAPVPSLAVQEKAVADFAARVMTGTSIERIIHYSVIGTRSLKTTTMWPPAGTVETRFYLTPDRSLSAGGVRAGTITGDNALDASSGVATRWTANTGVPAKYGDRRAASAKLLSFRTAVFATDQELVGHPVIRLQVSSADPDPAFFVYLEDVAPDGRVTYLTEGIFRAIHRKPADPATLPYDQGPAPHSFQRKDAASMTPGKAEIVEFALQPVAALVRKGHAVQISIAGADKDMFATHWGNRPGTYTVYMGPEGSTIRLPMRPWRE